MSLYPPPWLQTQQLVTAVLRQIQANHYADEASPHWDAEREYSAEQVALAARQLVRAVDALPAEQRPIGWDLGDLDTADRMRVRIQRLQQQVTDRDNYVAEVRRKNRLLRERLTDAQAQLEAAGLSTNDALKGA